MCPKTLFWYVCEWQSHPQTSKKDFSGPSDPHNPCEGEVAQTSLLCQECWIQHAKDHCNMGDNQEDGYKGDMHPQSPMAIQLSSKQAKL